MKGPTQVARAAKRLGWRPAPGEVAWARTIMAGLQHWRRVSVHEMTFDVASDPEVRLGMVKLRPGKNYTYNVVFVGEQLLTGTFSLADLWPLA